MTLQEFCNQQGDSVVANKGVIGMTRTIKDGTLFGEIGIEFDSDKQQCRIQLKPVQSLLFSIPKTIANLKRLDELAKQLDENKGFLNELCIEDYCVQNKELSEEEVNKLKNFITSLEEL